MIYFYFFQVDAGGTVRIYGRDPLSFRNPISNFLRLVVAFFAFLLLAIWIIMVARAYLLFR